LKIVKNTIRMQDAKVVVLADKGYLCSMDAVHIRINYPEQESITQNQHLRVHHLRKEIEFSFGLVKREFERSNRK